MNEQNETMPLTDDEKQFLLRFVCRLFSTDRAFYFIADILNASPKRIQELRHFIKTKNLKKIPK